MKITKEHIRRKIDQGLENYCGFKHRSYDNGYGVYIIEVEEIVFSRFDGWKGKSSRKHAISVMGIEVDIDDKEVYELFYYAKNRVEEAREKRNKDKLVEYFKDVK